MTNILILYSGADRHISISA